MADEGSLCIHTAFRGYLGSDGLYTLRALIVLLMKELTMKLCDIALKCLRYDA